MASAKGKVHLVGSLGFQNAEIAFRALAAKLGTRAPRYPDGEPGERGYWIRWQNRTFAEHPAFRLQDEREIEGYVDGKTRPLYVLDEEVDPDLLDIGVLGYAEEALASWSIFSELVDDGVIPSGTRFLVCMPSCAALLTSFIHPDDALAVEPALERSMRGEVERLVEEIPPGALAVQWDVAYEVIAVDGGPAAALLRRRTRRQHRADCAAYRLGSGGCGGGASISATATRVTNMSSNRRASRPASPSPTASARRRPAPSNGSTCRCRATATTTPMRRR